MTGKFSVTSGTPAQFLSEGIHRNLLAIISPGRAMFFRQVERQDFHLC